MAFEQEQRQAMHLLQGIENGLLDRFELSRLVGEADPALVYFVCTWLRSRYGGDHPAAEGVLGRLVELSQHDAVTRAKLREGKGDVIVAWFEDAYGYRDFDAQQFIALIVEKLEG